MTKKLLTFLILTVVLGGVLLPASSVLAQTPNCKMSSASTQNDGILIGEGGALYCAPINDTTTRAATGGSWTFDDIIFGPIGFAVKAIGYVLTSISAAFLWLAGKLFDTIVTYSVIDMAKHIGSGEGTLGESISQAWADLRDVANMFFIFVLLFVAFKAMFSLSFGDVSKNILNIIIVALLINFSLFFSKIVIDASNIVAIGFYNSITNAPVSSVIGEGSTVGSSGGQSTITTGYMRLLGLNGLYDTKVLLAKTGNASNILITSIMSSIFVLITAVIFLIAAVMFATRFVLLIFIMILSPLALIAFIIPGQQGLFNRWLNALIDQSFFAPLFFALTWVVFKVGIGLKLSETLLGANDASLAGALSNSPGGATLILNYVIVIGLSIAALVISKQMASKTAGFTAISGAIGAGAAGGTAWGLRNTVGAGGSWLAGKMAAAKGSDNLAKRTGARFLSYAGEKAAKSSFDARNAAIPTSIVGDAIRGTVGRTGFGKKIGLDDVNIQSIDVGNRLNGGIIGTAEKKGYRELKAESDKRVRERDAAEASEIKIAKAKNNILEGAKDGATTTAIDEMEKSLANLSDKETEALVASNRDLLESQNFANKISVKQLEAIVKSDQFSEEDKDKIKNSRFAEIGDINDAAGLAALAIPATRRTPDQIAAAAKVEKARTRVKGLADSELEMINPNYLDPTQPEGVEFIAQLKGNQVDSINKSSKFTSSQKEKVKTERMRPLMEALSAGRATDAQNIVRKADIKTKVGYMKPTGTPPVVIATHPDVVPIYTVKMLQRMAAHDDMTDDDIRNLRTAILMSPRANAATVTWLNDPNKGMIEFPP